MGFMDKLKGLFKKKEKAPAEPKKKEEKCECECGCADAPAKKCYADEFKAGDAPVQKSLHFAATKIDAGIENGTISEKRGELIAATLRDVAGSDADDETKMVQISQIIGGIYL